MPGMYALPLSTKDKEMLGIILANKVKEIHAWRVATNKPHRDEEYEHVARLARRLARCTVEG